MHRHPKFLFAALALAALAVQGCESCLRPQTGASVGGDAGAPVKGGRLIDASIGEPSVFLPPLVTDNASGSITGLVYAGLLKVGKDLNLEPSIAERWEVSPDGLVITFHLRHDVRFHDGHPLTADDVVFTYDVMMDPKTPSPYKPDFMDVKTFEKVDDYTVRVTYKKPFAPALTTFAGALQILPKHLLEGKNITDNPLMTHPVGAGPYKFVSWTKGDKVVLRANPDYFDGEPYITEYVFRVIPDQATQFLELQAGGIDQMTPTPVQYQRQTGSGFFQENINKYDYLGFGYTYLGFNLGDPRFKDKRVRRAISMAINRDELIQGVLLGLGEPGKGPYKPGAWYENSNVKPMPYDPEGAKKLLAEAGFTFKNGKAYQPDGKPFAFTIMTNQGNDSRRKTAEIIQRRLAEIGVDVQPRIVEWSSFINDFVDKRAFEAIILGWTGDIDPDQYSIWHSSQIHPKEYNFIGYHNAEVDDLLVRGRETFDQAERKKIYDRFQEILADEQPYAFLYQPKTLVVVHKKVHGIEPAPAGIGWNFEKWWIPAALQAQLTE